MYNAQYDLTNQKVENTFQQIVQYNSSSSTIYDGRGNSIDSFSASWAPSIDNTNAVSSSWASSSISSSYLTNTDFISGSVLFAGLNGSISQSNSRFFWDATNSRLGLGTSTPRGPLDVNTYTVQTVGNVTTNDSVLHFNYGSGQYNASDSLSFTYYIYAYKSGVFSVTPLVFGGSDDSSSNPFYLTASWNAVSDAESYRILVRDNYYFDISDQYWAFDTPYTSFSIGFSAMGYDDISSQTYNGGGPVVTPTSISSGASAYINSSDGNLISIGGATFNGFIGIGTPSPAWYVDVNSPTSYTFRNYSAGSSIFALGGAGDGYTYTAMQLSDGTDIRNRNGWEFDFNYDKSMAFTYHDITYGWKTRTWMLAAPTGTNDSGKMGVNTNTPMNALDVVGNISCSVITASLFNGAASQMPYSSSAHLLIPIVQTGSMYFKVSGSTRLLFIYDGTTWCSSSMA